MGLQNFTLLTDHKPLVPLINVKDLDRTPIRIQRMLMLLLRFNCTAKHVPGKELVVADTLSRAHPTEDTASIAKNVILDNDVEMHLTSIRNSWPMSDNRIQEVSAETANDETLKLVLKYVLNGWPEYMKDVPKQLQVYYANRNCLSHTDGILTYLNRVIVPKSLAE